MERHPVSSWILLTKRYHCTWRSKTAHSIPEKAHSKQSLQELEKFLTFIPGHVSDNGLARHYHSASSCSHSDSSECTQAPDWEIQSSLLHCSSFITCWSSSVLPIWQDCQFISNLILKSRCTASKPPGLSHMEVPSGLLLLQRDPATQLFPSRSTECQDKVNLVIEGGGNSDLLSILPWLRGWIGNRCLLLSIT